MITSDIGSYCLEGLLGASQEEAAFATFSALRRAITYDYKEDDIDGIIRRLIESYALLELHWPAMVMTIAMHLTMAHTVCPEWL